jgi:hypothetical protein
METKLIQVPLPIELRKRLQAVAKADRRSMTQEALSMLEMEIQRRESELGLRWEGVSAHDIGTFNKEAQ